MTPQCLRVTAISNGCGGGAQAAFADADQAEGAGGGADVGNGVGEVLAVGLADPPFGDAGAFGDLSTTAGGR